MKSHHKSHSLKGGSKRRTGKHWTYLRKKPVYKLKTSKSLRTRTKSKSISKTKSKSKLKSKSKISRKAALELFAGQKKLDGVWGTWRNPVTNRLTRLRSGDIEIIAKVQSKKFNNQKPFYKYLNGIDR